MGGVAYLCFTDFNPEITEPLEIRESDNIGLGGAFFDTPSPLPEGTPVKIDFALHFRRLLFPLNRRPLLRVQGHVLRLEPTGMAIRFEKRYTIVPHSPF